MRIRWARTLESGITSGVPLRGDSLSCVSHLINTIIFLTTYLSSQDAFLRSRFPKLGVAVPALLPVPVPRTLASGAVSAAFLTKANADDLLRDLVSLMDQVFIHKPRTEDACQWKVASFTMNDKKIEYGVLFADCDCPLQMGNNEIVNLIMESSQICKPPERSLFHLYDPITSADILSYLFQATT
jgi:hypothetical protein